MLGLLTSPATRPRSWRFRHFPITLKRLLDALLSSSFPHDLPNRRSNVSPSAERPDPVLSTYLRLREPPSPPSAAPSREAMYRCPTSKGIVSVPPCVIPVYFPTLSVLHSIALTHCSRLLGVFTAVSLYFAISCYIIYFSRCLMLTVVSCSPCQSSHACFLLSHTCPCLLMLTATLSQTRYLASVFDSGSQLRLIFSSQHECFTFSTWALDLLDMSCRPSQQEPLTFSTRALAFSSPYIRLGPSSPFSSLPRLPISPVAGCISLLPRRHSY